MQSKQVLEEVRRGLADLGIVRFDSGRLLFVDGDQDLAALTPPPSLIQSKQVWDGLQYLRTARPPVMLLLTRHTDGDDFYRLLEHTDHILHHSPVCGVEARAAIVQAPGEAIPRPVLHDTNKWLRAFQTEQFPWMEGHHILMLPCEPDWQGPFKQRMFRLDRAFSAMRDGTLDGYSPEAQQTMLHPLHAYLGIFRAWGLLGQFGHWLSRRRVQDRLTGYTDPIPLILGAAHTPEWHILQEYCGLDAVVILVAHHKENDPYSELYRKYQEAILNHGMPEVDLDVHFPTA